LGRCGLHASGSGYRPVAGYCEHSNELSGSMRERVELVICLDCSTMGDSTM